MQQLVRAVKANAGAEDGDVGVFKGYRDVSPYLTTNVTTPYILGLINLATDGPTVLEVPAGFIAWSVVDMWQRATTDIGVLGPDAGRGARFLLAGPGQQIPEAPGYLVMRSPTFRIVFWFRALDPDPAKAAALETGVQVYPHDQRDDPAPTRYLSPDPGSVAESTEDDYVDTVRLHLVPALGRKRLAKLTVAHLDRLWKAKRDAGYSSNSVRIMRTVLRRAL
jgi:hypothetical protein